MASDGDLPLPPLEHNPEPAPAAAGAAVVRDGSAYRRITLESHPVGTTRCYRDGTSNYFIVHRKHLGWFVAVPGKEVVGGTSDINGDVNRYDDTKLTVTKSTKSRSRTFHLYLIH